MSDLVWQEWYAVLAVVLLFICSVVTRSGYMVFGDYLPLIRRQDVKGFIQKQPLWLMSPLNLDDVRKFAENMEYEAARFYRRAAETLQDFHF